MGCHGTPRGGPGLGAQLSLTPSTAVLEKPLGPELKSADSSKQVRLLARVLSLRNPME